MLAYDSSSRTLTERENTQQSMEEIVSPDAPTEIYAADEMDHQIDVPLGS